MSQQISKICQCKHDESNHHFDVAGIPYCACCTCKDLVIVAYHDDLRNLVVVYTEKYPSSDELKAIESEYEGKAYQTLSPRQEGNETYQYATFMKKNKMVSVKPVGKKKEQDRRLF
jgi:hypothetical protein